MKKQHTGQSFFRLRVGICAALVCAVSMSAHANIITVTNTNDNGPGSLRNALAIANDGDTITFAVAGTITATSGELVVSSSINISGPGAVNLAVNGNAIHRVFHVSSGRTVTIAGLTITNGNACCSHPDDLGGGIYNDHATLIVSNCAINGNNARNFGGGIENDASNSSATLAINDTILINNTGFSGGGIFNDAEGAPLCSSLRPACSVITRPSTAAVRLVISPAAIVTGVPLWRT